MPDLITPSPTIHVLAGPNGVGKTTFADRYLPEVVKQLEFINADLIARGLSPYDPEAAAMEAGRIALRRIRHLITGRQSFTWETTLSGRSAVNWLTSARTQGYRLKGYFLWVRDVETTLDRICQRVTEGGHNIQVATTSRRRFPAVASIRRFRTSLPSTVRYLDHGGSLKMTVPLHACWLWRRTADSCYEIPRDLKGRLRKRG